MSIKTSGIINIGNVSKDFGPLIKITVDTVERMSDWVEINPSGKLVIEKEGEISITRHVDNFNKKEITVGDFFKGSLENKNADSLFKKIVFRLDYFMRGSGEFRGMPQFKGFGEYSEIIPGEIIINPLKALGASLDNDYELNETKLKLRITEVIHHELHHAAEWAYYQSRGDYFKRVEDSVEDWGYGYKNINLENYNKGDRFFKKLIKDRKQYSKEIDYNNNFTELRAYVLNAFYSTMQYLYSNGLYKKEDSFVKIKKSDMLDYLKEQEYFTNLVPKNKGMFLKNLVYLLKNKNIVVS